MDAPQSPFGPAEGDEYDSPRDSAENNGADSPTHAIVLGGSVALDAKPLRWQPAAEVRVSLPEKHGEGFKDAYVSYEVLTRWTTGSPREARVRRRYQDFVWLSERYAADKAAGAVVPPLPERNRLGFMDRFGPEFVRRRQEALQRFLHRLLVHPRLGQNAALRAFLTAPVLELTSDHGRVSSDAYLSMEVSQASFFDAANLPVPEGAGEEAFLVMRRAVGTIEGHFERAAGLHARAMSAARGLSQASMDMRAGASMLASALGRLDALLPELSDEDAAVLSGVLVPGVRSPPSSPLSGHATEASGVPECHTERSPTADDSEDVKESTRLLAGPEVKMCAPKLPVALHALFEDISARSFAVGELQHSLAERLDYGVAAPASEFAACCKSARHALRHSDVCRQTARAARDGLVALEREYASLTGGEAPLTPANGDANASKNSTSGEGQSQDSACGTHGRPRLAVEAGAQSAPSDQRRTSPPQTWSTLVSYVSSRIDAMRGKDTESSRAERAEKLRTRILVARTEREAALRRSLETDACVQAEFATFLRVLDAEFRDVFVPALAEYIREHRTLERAVFFQHHASF